jgi:hypothetical protein
MGGHRQIRRVLRCQARDIKKIILWRELEFFEPLLAGILRHRVCAVRNQFRVNVIKLPVSPLDRTVVGDDRIRQA